MSTLSWVRGWWLCLCFVLVAFSQAQESAATLRLVHLSPDAPRVDLLIDGELRVTDLSFSRFSDYLPLPPGEHEVQVFPHRLPRRFETVPGAVAGGAVTGGAEATQPRAAPASRRLEPVTTLISLDEGVAYTLALVGLYEPPPPERELGGLAVNVVPEDSRIDVNGADGYFVSLTGSETLRELRPGVYTLSVRRDGYQPSQYNVEVQPGLTTTATVTLQREETGAQELPPQVATPNRGNVWHKVELQLYQDTSAETPTAEQAVVQVIHAAPTSQAVDVALVSLNQDGEQAEAKLSTGLAFPNNSDEVAVATGSYDLQLYTVDTSYALTTLSGLWLEPGPALQLLPGGDTRGGTRSSYP